MELTEVIGALRQWLSGAGLPAQVLTDRADALRVIFETDYALAELIAGDGEFSPYRFVSFTVLDTRLEVSADPVFCFRDDETHTIPDILRELDRGLEQLRSL